MQYVVYITTGGETMQARRTMLQDNEFCLRSGWALASNDKSDIYINDYFGKQFYLLSSLQRP
jgi:hypothetical protein